MSSVLTEREANVVIANLRKNGMQVAVTRVDKDGYIVKATEMPEEKAVGPAPLQEEAVISEETCGGDEDESLEVPVAAEDDEVMELPGEEGSEEEVVSAAGAKLKVLAFNQCGKNARVTKVGVNHFVVTAEDDEVLPESSEEEPVEAADGPVSDDEMAEILGDDGVEDILDQKQAEGLVQAMVKKGISAKVTRVESGFVVTAADEPAAEESSSESSEEEGDETEILSESEAENLISAMTKRGIPARVTRVESGYVVVADEALVEDVPAEEPVDANDDPVSDDEMAKVLGEDADDDVLSSEEDVTAAVKKIKASGKKAKVHKVKGGFKVTAEDAPADAPAESAEEITEEVPEESGEELSEAQVIAEARRLGIMPENHL